MNAENRFKWLANASKEQLEAVDRVITGSQESNKLVSLKLLKMGEFCKAASLSRTSLWRCIRDGQIRTAEIRPGVRRVPEAELVRLATGAV